ncbi:MAG: MBOAT family protein [Kiritimatiellia bacterium]
MLFPTIDFAVFFLAVFLLGMLLRKHVTAWKWFMLSASYFFYGYWDWRFIGLLLGSSIVNHLAALGLARFSRLALRRGILTVAVLLNLAPLFFFKYSNFFAQQAFWLVSHTSLVSDVQPWMPVFDYLGRVILPVGISFFTFQALSYIVDVYRRQMAPAERWLDFALYLAFFPQLVAGPIVRARDLLGQIARPLLPARLDAGRAAALILGGLFKKIVVANYLSEQIVDPVFARPDLFGAWDTLLAVYAYAIQIYCDFSAYSDIAIGLCLLMGFQIPINFNAPYLAGSIQKFWRRWHISLSSFLRDYLYIPLGGSRLGEFNTCRNLLVTFLLGGLWHGAGWTFIVWGGLHGLYLIIERLGSAWLVRRNRHWSGPWAALVRGLIVWHLVCFAWLFFRGQSFGDALAMLQAMTRWRQPVELVTTMVPVMLVVGYLTQLLDGHRCERLWDWIGRRHPVWLGLAAAVGLTIILGLGPKGVAPFIYFQF